ncbi:hypothetical protein BJX66DRAFT_32486 [Aspergillus keveii]|uniref:Uncharacterized protein n=1 Tax=Aspergillus keveii TaxID=714993 RepID=A0ABR4FT13_9EURO
MSNSPGYEIIRAAIPKALAQSAAEALLAQPKHSREKYDAIELPPVCSEITTEFVNNTQISVMAKLASPKAVHPQPDHVFAGMFRKTAANPKNLKTAEKGEIYATVALTPLSSGTGWYTFYEGSRANIWEIGDKTPATALSLEVGDVMVWRGDLIYCHSSGGGGMFQTIVYKEK